MTTILNLIDILIANETRIDDRRRHQFQLLANQIRRNINDTGKAVYDIDAFIRNLNKQSKTEQIIGSVLNRLKKRLTEAKI